LIGLETDQLFFWAFQGFILCKRPLETSIKLGGTVTLISILSTLSYIWSLLGHLAPKPWQEEAINDFPFVSFCQVIPPSQGGLTATLGFPP
jgi:hypothetical protein